MKKRILIFSIIAASAVAGFFFLGMPKQSNAPTEIPDEITKPDEQPAPKPADTNPYITIAMAQDETIYPGFVIKGKTKGNWFFEGSFPIYLQDNNGNLLEVALATAQEDWMSEGKVSFEAQLLQFRWSASGTGKLIFKKENPSGLPENDESIELPIRFPSEEPLQVQIFLGSKVLNPNSTDCSDVFALTRFIPQTNSVARESVEMLLLGPTWKENNEGYFSSIPKNTKLQSINLKDGVLTADFSKELNQVAGSCNVIAIRSQIEKTLMQFPTVKQVIISVNGDSETALQP